MISLIKQITLIDGKQLFYPNEKEIEKMKEQVASLIIERELTVEEFTNKYHCVECFVNNKL